MRSGMSLMERMPGNRSMKRGRHRILGNPCVSRERPEFADCDPIVSRADLCYKFKGMQQIVYATPPDRLAWTATADDLITSIEVSERMRLVKRRDTRPELALRKRLHALGFRYRVDRSPDGGRIRADLVFVSQRVAVFVDGCFWHGCPDHGSWPHANADWWRAKIHGTIRRDRTADVALETSGWTVVRVWEHEPADLATSRVVASLAGRSRARSSLVLSAGGQGP
jgi:DNA mismatch endonuclease, patch repair protein